LTECAINHVPFICSEESSFHQLNIKEPETIGIKENIQLEVKAHLESKRYITIFNRL